MGGISVLLGMGVFIGLIIAFILCAIFVIVSYILEAVSLFSFRRNSNYKNHLICFIPCYNKYLYGKFGNSKFVGMSSCVIGIAKITTFILWFFYNNSMAFWLLVAFTIINFILNTIMASRIYKNYSKYDVVFTIFSIVSLGILRPVFLFAIRNNKKV